MRGHCRQLSVAFNSAGDERIAPLVAFDRDAELGQQVAESLRLTGTCAQYRGHRKRVLFGIDGHATRKQAANITGAVLIDPAR